MELTTSFQGDVTSTETSRFSLSRLIGCLVFPVFFFLFTTIPFGVMLIDPGWLESTFPQLLFLTRLDEDATGMLMFGLFCFGILGFVAFGAINSFVRRQVRRSKLEDAVVRIEGAPLKPGQSFDVQYSQRIKSATDIEGITVKLILREWVRYTSGTDTVTKTHDHIIDERMIQGRNYTSSSTIMENVRFKLPRSAMHTWANRQWITEHIIDPQEVEEKLQDWERQKDQMPTWLQNMVDAGLNASHGLGTGIDDNTLTWHVLFKVNIPRSPDYNQAWEVPVIPTVSTEEDLF